MSEEIRPGRYRHFKGKEYEVLGVIILGQQVHAIFGKQSDTLRQLLDEHFTSRK